MFRLSGKDEALVSATGAFSLVQFGGLPATMFRLSGKDEALVSATGAFALVQFEGLAAMMYSHKAGKNSLCIFRVRRRINITCVAALCGTTYRSSERRHPGDGILGKSFEEYSRAEDLWPKAA